MKKVFKMVTALSLVAGVLAFTGCTDYEEDINALGDRVTAVENALDDLQGQIESGAVITDVASTADGITITLSNGDTYTVKNGEKGEKGDKGDKGDQGDKGDPVDKGDTGSAGAAGAPGSVVTMGSDGYWYIDGEKQPYRWQAENGTNGKDAPTVYYRPNIETGCWDKVTETKNDAGEIVTDVEPTEISWKGTYTGVTAIWNTEEGTLTIGLTDADGVPTGETVTIELNADLKSLAFVPEVLKDGLGVINFYNIMVEDEFVTSNQPKVTYRINPKNADLTNVEWSFINRTVTTKVAGDAADLVSIVGEPVVENGGATFTVKANKALETVSPKETIVALQAVSEGKTDDIVSDYSFVEQEDLDQFQIIDKVKYEAEESAVDPFGTPIDDSETVDVNTLTADLNLVYDKELVVSDYLETYAAQATAALHEIGVEPVKYVVNLVEGKYLDPGSKTDQNAYVSLDEVDGEWVLTVNKDFAGEGGRPAINRTPVLEVYSQVQDAAGKYVTVAEAYIVVEITEDEVSVEPLPEKTYHTVNGEFEYTEIDPSNGETMSVSWSEVSQKVLNELNMSYAEFIAKFNVEEPVIYYKDEKGEWKELTSEIAEAMGVSATAEGFDSENTATAIVSATVTNQVDENTTGAIKVVIESYNDKVAGDVAIEFNYSVSHNHVWPEFSDNYYDEATNTVTVKGRPDDAAAPTKWEMVSGISEHFFEYLENYKRAQNHSTDIMFELPWFREDGTPVAHGDTGGEQQKGATLTNGSDYKTAEIALNEPLTEPMTYVVRAYEQLANGHYCEMYYNVRFESPFKVALADVSLKTLIAEASTADLSKMITITDEDNNVIFKDGKIGEGAAKYKLTADDFVFEFELAYNSGNTEAEFNDHLGLAGSTVSWNNAGATLRQDMNADYEVTVTISDICKLTSEGNIKILSSENSK